MRGTDWLFLALAVISAGAAFTCAYYARNCQANTDLVIREILFRLHPDRADSVISELREDQ